MTKTRCKFICHKIVSQEGSDAKQVMFRTSYCPEVAEDIRFTKYTPSGEMTVTIDNPAALSMLEVGKYYYIDIIPATA